MNSEGLVAQRTAAHDLHQFILTFPGLIATNGMNSKGVGITTNTLKQLAHSRDGLSVAFVVRGVLERQTFDEAQMFLKSVHHASGQNYTVGGIADGWGTSKLRRIRSLSSILRNKMSSRLSHQSSRGE